MTGKDVVGVGRVVISKRERPIILEPLGKGLRYKHPILRWLRAAWSRGNDPRSPALPSRMERHDAR
jgi:hypothetical protein